MITRRRVITGLGVLGVGAAGARFGAALRPSTSGVDASGSVQIIDESATVTEPACRVSAPLAIHWIGGSDVELNEVSLPDATASRLTSIGPRPVTIDGITGIAPMAPDTATMIDDAVAAGADAIVASINLVWQHWDGESCRGMTPPHDFYSCLLSHTSDEVDDTRHTEMQHLVDTATASGVPCYLYTAPHSTDALTDPVLADQIAAGEDWVDSFDPHDPLVRVVAESFTRDLPPFIEGIDFHDMVHPTATGADRLADWLAADIGSFLGGLDLDPC